MPQIEKHPFGSFCWVELATTDQNSAKAFYTSLFGWQIEDMPMGPNAFYSIFKVNGGDAGAAHTLLPEMSQQGIPPNWTLYIAVDDVDTAAKRAGELGGIVCKAPFDISDIGRIAALQDPTGTAFCLWQAKNQKGTRTLNENGALCWADLNTNDKARAQTFYSRLLGWKFEEGDNNYTHIKNGDDYIGGMPMEEHGLPPHWLAYFQVADCDASTAKCKSLGGTVHFGPTSLENVGRFSVLGDPQGAVFAVFQPEMK
jgi:predicted enzyme related to lactoylglutathione lyase